MAIVRVHTSVTDFVKAGSCLIVDEHTPSNPTAGIIDTYSSVDTVILERVTPDGSYGQIIKSRMTPLRGALLPWRSAAILWAGDL